MLTEHKSQEFVPMVAFSCKRPSMFLSEKGWTKDPKTDCLKNPKEILEYCKEIYPNLDIKNVVESSSLVSFKGWCKINNDNCSQKEIKIRPFRCLVSPFVSDALWVPEKCIFDYVHKSNKCQSFSSWNKTALEMCRGKRMGLESIGMIQPCGLDKFTGVEFVCCNKKNIIDDNRGKGEEKKYKEANKKKIFPNINKKNKKIEQKDNNSNKNKKEKKQKIEKKNKIEKVNFKNNEKNFVDKKLTPQITRVTTKNIQQTKEKQNFKNKQINKFNKNLKKIIAESQSTIQNPEIQLKKPKEKNEEENKKTIYQKYLRILNEKPINISQVLILLKQYIRRINKEKNLIIEKYNDKRQEKISFNKMETKLKEADEALNEALLLLERVPKHGKKMKNHIDDFMTKLPKNSLTLKNSLNIKKLTTEKSTTLQNVDPPSSKFTPPKFIESKLYEKIQPISAKSSSFNPNSFQTKNHKKPEIILPTMPLTSDPPSHTKFSPDINHLPIPGKMVKDHVVLEQTGPRRINMRGKKLSDFGSGDNLTNPAGIILTSIGLVLIIVIGIIALIKRVNNVPVTNGYLDRPLKKRTETMKKVNWSLKEGGGAIEGGGPGGLEGEKGIKGYENPTYRFYDSSRLVS